MNELTALLFVRSLPLISRFRSSWMAGQSQVAVVVCWTERAEIVSDSSLLSSYVILPSSGCQIERDWDVSVSRLYITGHFFCSPSRSLSAHWSQDSSMARNSGETFGERAASKSSSRRERERRRGALQWRLRITTKSKRQPKSEREKQ